MIGMRTASFVAGSVLLASLLMAVAMPASATCVIYGTDSEVCASANAGTPTFGNDGKVCVDSLCPSVHTNGDFCAYWVHDGQLLVWTTNC